MPNASEIAGSQASREGTRAGSRAICMLSLTQAVVDQAASSLNACLPGAIENQLA